ncbi:MULTISPECIES: hypothetical protein [unclassified Pseudomonas]|uniref:hypothetical protein n=1 Tax=unclassified Pseudomonas TaxID=196821 RepID=UPI000A1D9ECE|nr:MULTISPECIES: hypothetical protein [unclassified Pseudomonas]
MKLHKVLSINGQPVDLVRDEVRLDLRTPGRASFTVKAATPLRGLVTLDLGYNDKPLQRHFVGYIERSTTANKQEQGLRFRVPDTAYAKVRAPYFYSLGGGIQALDSLAQVFSIPDFVWHQQGDGEMYVGSWADSYWGTRPALQLPVELFDTYQGNQSAEIATLPGLRPGASINNGQRITSVTLTGTQMVLKWKTP